MDTNTNNNTNSANPETFDYERFAMEEQAVQAASNNKPEAPKTARSKKEKAGGSEIYDWMQSLVSALLICVLVFSFFFRVIGIIGSSMVPTFHDGDSVVISNLFYTPKQGDIIVLRKLAFQEEPIIKRIIATEGQTVDIDFGQGIVYVDDVALEEPYINELTLTPLNFDGKVTVPQGSVFVMGDNRNHSTDSRDATISFVDERYILGKVLWRILPLDQFGSVN